MVRSQALIFLVLATVVAAPASAQGHDHEDAACAAPPAELAGWAAAHETRVAAATASQLGSATLPVGTAVDARLHATPSIGFPVVPARPGGAGSFGGLFAFDVAQAATYRVALSTAAWVDVVSGGAVANASGHGHGPQCTGIRKMVDYALEPGPHVLQLSGNGDAAISLMVTRLP